MTAVAAIAVRSARGFGSGGCLPEQRDHGPNLGVGIEFDDVGAFEDMTVRARRLIT
jgi:hypothetical protein